MMNTRLAHKLGAECGDGSGELSRPGVEGLEGNDGKGDRLQGERPWLEGPHVSPKSVVDVLGKQQPEALPVSGLCQEPRVCAFVTVVSSLGIGSFFLGRRQRQAGHGTLQKCPIAVLRRRVEPRIGMAQHGH